MCLKSTTFNFVLFYDSMIFWLVTENNRSCLRLDNDSLLFKIILYPHNDYTYHFVPNPLPNEF